MRLINFGVGEMSDRLSILALKLLHGAEAGKDVTHWRTELSTLLGKLAGRSLNGSWFEKYTELAAVNAGIWYNEDELRRLRKAGAVWSTLGSTDLTGAEDLKRLAPQVLAVAMRSQALNDRRAELIEAINKEVGDHIGGEKLT